MSLLKKLSLVITIFTLPTIIIVVSIGTALVRYAASQASASQQNALATRLISDIDRELYGRQQELLRLSKNNVVAGLLTTKDAASVTGQLAQAQAIAAADGGWAEIKVITTSGYIASALDIKLKGQAVLNSQQEWQSVFNQALTNGTAHSDAFFDGKGAKPSILLAVRVQDATKKEPIGVMIGKVTWDALQDTLQLDSGRVVTLFNSKRVILADSTGPAKDGAMQPRSGKETAIQNVYSGEKAAEAIEKNKQGEVFVSAVREPGYKDYHGNKWVLQIKAPNDLALASVNKILPGIASIMVLATIFMGVVLLAIINKEFIEPLKDLTVVTQKIAAGDFAQNLEVKSQDEFGKLTTSFNIMAQKLQEMYGSLERKVNEKTAELAQKVREVGAERAKAEALLGSIGEGMIAVDPPGHILRINQSALTALGLDGSKTTGALLTDAITLYDEHDAPLASTKSPTVQSLAQGKRIEQLLNIHASDGRKIVVRAVATPIIQEGHSIGAIMVIRDVTKEREVDRMKTEFISLASHQLRTPLSAIRWFTEMLLTDESEGLTLIQKEYAKNVYDSSDRMNQLVGGLLNISRIESGRLMVEPQPTDLRVLVNGIVNDLKAKTEERKQNVLVSIHDGLPEINIDPQLIGQVYMNFLSNAVKYTPEGGEITVFISRKEDQIISQISDNGYGIPINQQDKLFQKFFRAENAVKVETDGTGLGLYLVKSIIESYGGKVWFKSEEDKGSTFWFTIPLAGMKARKGEVTLDSMHTPKNPI